MLQLTPTLNNVVNIKWAADYGKNWVVGIWLVEKLTSDQLLDRLVRGPITARRWARDTHTNSDWLQEGEAEP